MSLGALAAMTHADPITVLNHSFEQDIVADGGVNSDGAANWQNQGGGIIDGNGSSGFGPLTPVTPDADGEQMYWSNIGVVYQVLSATLAANTRYSVIVDVGDRSDAAFGGSPQIRLGSGATLGTNLLTPNIVANETPDFSFETWEYTFTTAAAPAGEGDALRVELVSNGAQTLFDNVRIDANVVPEPSVIAMMALGFVSLVKARRRRR